MAQDTPIPERRGERILAFMIAAAVGLSLICILAIIIGTAVGVRNFGEGIWPFVVVLPTPGLILGFLLMVALLVTSLVRRGREAKDAHQ